MWKRTVKTIELLRLWNITNLIFRRNMQSLCYAVYFLHGPFFIGVNFISRRHCNKLWGESNIRYLKCNVTHWMCIVIHNGRLNRLPVVVLRGKMELSFHCWILLDSLLFLACLNIQQVPFVWSNVRYSRISVNSSPFVNNVALNLIVCDSTKIVNKSASTSNSNDSPREVPNVGVRSIPA